MKNIISTIISAVAMPTTSFAIAFIPLRATLAQENPSLPELKQQAQEFTVKIIPPSGEWGSGVIVGQNGDTYYVLTASHVVSEIVEGEDFYLMAFDGEKYNKYGKNKLKIEFLPNDLDLALVQLKKRSPICHRDHL